jgi:hypothetical protein
VTASCRPSGATARTVTQRQHRRPIADGIASSPRQATGKARRACRAIQSMIIVMKARSKFRRGSASVHFVTLAPFIRSPDPDATPTNKATEPTVRLPDPLKLHSTHLRLWVTGHGASHLRRRQTTAAPTSSASPRRGTGFRRQHRGRREAVQQRQIAGLQEPTRATPRQPTATTRVACPGASEKARPNERVRDDPAIRIGREAALSDREGARRMLAQHAACRDED